MTPAVGMIEVVEKPVMLGGGAMSFSLGVFSSQIAQEIVLYQKVNATSDAQTMQKTSEAQVGDSDASAATSSLL